MQNPLPEELMALALSLASIHTRSVLPNPAVGAVLVANNKIIGKGCHEYFGGPHAEVNAIAAVKDPTLLTHSTLYVTLEPCAHTGKTPPCVDLIIASKIPRVVVGCRDPHPKVAGRGIAALRNAGVSVTEGVLHDECVRLNKRFILTHKERRPYIILKWAQTRNRLVAPSNRERTQITSSYSQQLLHYWRGQEMSIAVGCETVRVDNPRLTVRHDELYCEYERPPHQPTRVVIGNAQRLSRDRALWEPDAPTIVFTPADEPLTLGQPSITVVRYGSAEPFIPQVCCALYERHILSMLVEGGPRTLQGFIDADLWDEIRIFTAPCTFASGVAAPITPHPPQWITTSGPDTLELLAHPKLASRLGIAETRIVPLLASSVPPRHYDQTTQCQSD
jgi:diaminohydroxyphosphoribosylaminopyrimidine deaminase/5-amino-6-(5-phosphoribosylamino)uracil reductase